MSPGKEISCLRNRNIATKCVKFALFCCFLAIGCQTFKEFLWLVPSSDPETVAEESNFIPMKVNDAVHLLAPKLYQVTSNDNSKTVEQLNISENLVLSPFSIFSTLAITLFWAKGSTLKEVERNLNLTVNASLWKEELSRFLQECETPDESLRNVAIDNRLRQEGFPIQEKPGLKIYPNHLIEEIPPEKNMILDEKPVIKDIGTALLVSAKYPFKLYEPSDQLDISPDYTTCDDLTNSEAARNKINEAFIWLTHGMATEAIPKGSLNTETAMVLLNGFYFRGLWSTQICKNATYDQAFFTSNSDSYPVPTMHVRGGFKVAELTEMDARAILIPFKDERHGLIILLPNKISELKELEKRVLQSGLTPNKLVEVMEHHNVSLALPKFRIDFKMEMSNILRQMGLIELFSPKADLSNFSFKMSSEIGTKLDLYHHSAIEVTENGVDSALVTATEASKVVCEDVDSSDLVRFEADHPFLFFLVDLRNDAIPLLFGRLTNPIAQ